jgi:hypothetical protein
MHNFKFDNDFKSVSLRSRVYYFTNFNKRRKKLPEGNEETKALLSSETVAEILRENKSFMKREGFIGITPDGEDTIICTTEEGEKKVFQIGQKTEILIFNPDEGKFLPVTFVDRMHGFTFEA